MRPSSVGLALVAIIVVAAIGFLLYDPVMDLIFTDRDGMDRLTE